ncbi:MAG: tRNA lysidine(34) synthetase TilS [Melioribacteraceae bacterium]|nr:tRNA lysidine(34) synthetase TilS [Melioribacteraceae bacterium]
MNKTIEQKVINFIDTHKLISEGDKLLVGLSGGPDSVFLIHFLKKFQRKYKIEISAAHLNHKLRGNDSEKDEEFCKNLCMKLNVEFVTTHSDIKKLKSTSKKSIEELARIERYKFFEYTAAKIHADKIVTAHNLNDNTETILLNLFKGTGIKGIAGIPIQRNKIIRPVLSISKKEIVDYLRKSKLKYRKDKSNEENNYQRNIIRNKIVPIIESELNPGFSEAIFRTSLNMRLIAKIISTQTQSFFKKYVDQQENKVFIKLNLFTEVDELFIDEVLKLSLVIFLHSEVTSKDILKLRKLAESQVGSEVKFKNNFSALRERELLLLKRSTKFESTESKIRVGQSLRIEDCEISIYNVKNSRFIMNQSGCEHVSLDVEHPTFTIRKWKDGDKFIPLGMQNFKKVSDFLIDKKISSSNKKNQLVLTYRNQIIWLVGLRIDERFKITTNTKRAFKLCLKMN